METTSMQETAAGTKGDDAFTEGRDYLVKGYYDKAAESFTKAINLGCADMAMAYIERGGIYLLRHQYDQAINDYTTSIRPRLDPNSHLAYSYRGAEYLWKGQYDHAVSDLSIVIGLNSNYADAYHWRGEAYFRKGMKSEAIRDAEKALSLDPNEQTLKTICKRYKEDD